MGGVGGLVEGWGTVPGREERMGVGCNDPISLIVVLSISVGGMSEVYIGIREVSGCVEEVEVVEQGGAGSAHIASSFCARGHLSESNNNKREREEAGQRRKERKKCEGLTSRA